MTVQGVKPLRINGVGERSSYAIAMPDGCRLTMTDTGEGEGSVDDVAGQMCLDLDVPLLVQGSRVVGAGHHDARMHPLTIAAMEKIGIDVAEATRWALGPHLWCASLKDGSLWQADRRYVVRPGGEVVIHCDVDGGRLAGSMFVLPLELPETIVAAAEGRLLREVAETALDPVDLRILKAWTMNDRTRFEIIPASGHVMLRTATEA
jgi:hypothetical protein